MVRTKQKPRDPPPPIARPAVTYHMAASRIHAVLIDRSDRFVAVAADDSLFLHDWAGTKCVSVKRALNGAPWAAGLCTDPTDSNRVLMLQFDAQLSTAQFVSIDVLGLLASQDPFVRIGPVANRFALFDPVAVLHAQSAHMISRSPPFDHRLCPYPRSRLSSMQHTTNGAVYVVDGRAWIAKFAANDFAAPPVRVPLFVEMPINVAATQNLDVNVVLASRDDLLFAAFASRVSVVRDEAVIFTLLSPEYLFASPPSLTVAQDFVVVGCEKGTAAVLRFSSVPLDRDDLSWLDNDPARRAQLDRWRIGDEWPDENCFFAATEFALECVAASDSVTPMYGRDTSGVGVIGNNVWVGHGAVLVWFARDRCLEATQYVHATTDVNELVDNTTFGTHGQYLMVGSDSAVRSSALIAEARSLLPLAPEEAQRNLDFMINNEWHDAVLLRIPERDVLVDRWWRDRQRWRLLQVANGLASLGLPALLVWHIFEWDDISVDENLSMGRAWNVITLIKNKAARAREEE